MQTDLDRALHGAPDLGEKVPDLRAFVQLDVFAQGNIAPFAELVDLGEGIFGIDLVGLRDRLTLNDDIAAADGHHAHIADLLAATEGEEIERVRVWERLGRIIAELHLRALLAQHGVEHAVGAVAAPGLAERLIKLYAVKLRVGIAPQELLRGVLRPDRVRAGGAFADFENVSNRFHGLPP